MAKFIAYEWDDQSVRAISASAKGSDIAIHALVEKPLEAPNKDTTPGTILENTISAASLACPVPIAGTVVNWPPGAGIGRPIDWALGM